MSFAHYDKAPVVEAIIDLQVRYKERAEACRFDDCYAKLASQFPSKAPIHQVHMGVLNTGVVGSGMHFQSGQMQVGLRLSTQANDRILQLQQKGFTYSHLPPYTDWNTFSGEAKGLWRTFVETCDPEKVTRVAVRFINRVIIPRDIIELYDYFNLYPHIPQGIPQDVNGLFLQLQMPQPDLAPPVLAVINLAIDQPPGPGQMAILLDFDIFKPGEYAPGSNEVWDFLDRLRMRKNELFEACITDTTRSLIS